MAEARISGVGSEEQAGIKAAVIGVWVSLIQCGFIVRIRRCGENLRMN